MDKQPRISLFGHFGAGNFGNESTLEAMLSNLHRLVPSAEITCICSVPEIVAAEYKISALPINEIVVSPWSSRSSITKIVRGLFVGIPSELYRWAKTFATLRRMDMLIVVGTGLLTDAFGIGSWGPYSSFKWSLAAKLCRCRIAFVSVGAGPLERHTGRFFVKSALGLADFRSYRDETTLKYLTRLGFDPKGDRVYPDLAFGLPITSKGDESTKKERQVVGLGLMVYGGMYGIEKTTEAHYAVYLKTLSEFATWLLGRGYDIRMLIGDPSDMPITQDFVASLKERSLEEFGSRIASEPITSAQDLLSKIAQTDFVVATRFHNVLLSLFLKKPTISVSFHHKCSSLMSQMQMSEYCQDIKQIDLQTLIQQFQRLEEQAESIQSFLEEKVTGCREALEEQYHSIFKEFLCARQPFDARTQ